MKEVEIEGKIFRVGDKVELRISDTHIIEKGIVAFGAFYAEIYQVYGFYVSDEDGNQISESGLTGEHTIVN